MFSISIMPEKSTKRARLVKSLPVASQYTRFLTGKRSPPSNQSLPVHKCDTGFVESLFFVYKLLLQLNGLLMCMDVERQTK